MATMIISSVVFGSIMRFDLKDFVVFLYAGMLPWNFFGISIDFCGVSILNNEGFIKKIYLPKICVSSFYGMFSVYQYDFFDDCTICIHTDFGSKDYCCIIVFTNIVCNHLLVDSRIFTPDGFG